MNTSKMLRKLAGPAVLAGAAMIPAFGSGCSAADQITNGLCCTDFEVGAVMTPAQFGLDANAQTGLQFTAFMNAAGDFSAAATGIVGDVAAACENIAVDLGESPGKVDATLPANDRAKQWCAAAVAQIQAQVTAKGNVELTFQAPKCTVNVSAQANCQAECSGKADCKVDPGAVEANCEGGISGKCEGACTGSCQGSADVAVTCGGKCDGTCEGTCMGSSDAGGKCEGSCMGKCRGTCEASGSAMAKCEGSCSGSCSVDIKAPKCEGKLKPPSAKCEATAECSGSCNASASAKAECTPPAIAIKASGGIDAGAIATLQANLPEILAVFKGRGKALVEVAAATAKLGVSVTASAPSLSVKAGLCVIPAAKALTAAATNITASVEASTSVAGSVGVNLVPVPRALAVH